MITPRKVTLEDIKNKYSTINSTVRCKNSIYGTRANLKPPDIRNDRVFSQRNSKDLLTDQLVQPMTSARSFKCGKIFKNISKIKLYSTQQQKHEVEVNERSKLKNVQFLYNKTDSLADKRHVFTLNLGQQRYQKIPQRIISYESYNSAQCIQNVNKLQKKIKLILCSK